MQFSVSLMVETQQGEPAETLLEECVSCEEESIEDLDRTIEQVLQDFAEKAGSYRDPERQQYVWISLFANQETFELPLSFLRLVSLHRWHVTIDLND